MNQKIINSTIVVASMFLAGCVSNKVLVKKEKEAALAGANFGLNQGYGIGYKKGEDDGLAATSDYIKRYIISLTPEQLSKWQKELADSYKNQPKIYPFEKKAGVSK